MKLMKLTLAAICAVLIASTAMAMNMKPGEGVTLKPARATWNTGFFQEALARRGLEELGYEVKKPKDLANPIAYKSIYLGDIDYWCNGNFPLHNDQLPKNFEKKGAILDPIIKAGGMQGYLVSKKEVEKFGIKSLDDFKRPEVIKAFDQNGDGKADLVACPPGWGCEKVIGQHMKAYDLGKYIKPIKAAYEAGMASALGAYKAGKPVFFYTWTPNWTVYKLQPGKDVMWINVPENPEFNDTVSGVQGAVSDPLRNGFMVYDITVVANKKFMEENPAAATFLKSFKLTIGDVSAQNTRMNAGEKSDKDIAKHVDEWIAAHQDAWNGWLDAARKAAK
ncbi:glycine betaine/L-proline ABC transporter substrate-binding protein ProX [Pseudodesulfovibrio sp. zrk46]|uniref:glycine betaine/L-proline ABC transporter substrate-binding protein ProX n=1 Tax=Pseudodesulfovibrio sp. zrk46 TaxID=2725288 RepID=UPI0014493F24|nr:glycine betaine/L-proline ABC transporter substrate-binding protein ProX [Pseudodesulfovibrio sp. zrk46]QJB57213.1 glycine betaine/L-proline ABC transporter substrate-binding protein ProX [Pseudodesulfovibrio sp. zrk46]